MDTENVTKWLPCNCNWGYVMLGTPIDMDVDAVINVLGSICFSSTLGISLWFKRSDYW